MPSFEQTQAHESKIYSEFSHLYDRIFTRVFFPRINRVIRALDIPPGARVLEVGVGTGLSFPAYPPHCHVTGIDLAPEMLEQAQEKINRNAWRHINVMPMDALDLKFAEDTFDYVMAFHVVSVVPDQRRLMNEVQRVCRPHGSVVVINHFRSPQPVLAALDRSIEPITRRLGWRTLNQDDVFEGLPLRIRRQYKTSPRSLFTIVVAENQK
jgi:phosphatidylethanolamine/phosphatidyl-N-methylethanolamine N-methyltransferase